MIRRIAVAILIIASSAPAGAQEAEVTATTSSTERSSIEVGLFLGGFISNYFHQFYDIDIPNRQELERVNPELGLRFAKFLTPWLGLEAEAAWVMGTTKQSQDNASIFGLRAQGVFQRELTRQIVPFAAIGLGLARTHSDDAVLGKDSDMLLHVGGGVKLFVTDMIAIRAEGRFLRGPSQQAPYHLNASYGELMIGVSFLPRTQPAISDVADTAVVVADADSDGDGVVDRLDTCAAEAEDMDLFDDTDGCPDLDNDGDTIADTNDKCPLEAEDNDEFQDDDGCPDRDNDSDGVADAGDRCPSEPEDTDGFKDVDGCPDYDNDVDGIADAQDKCPNETEVINGVDDDDGCPDQGESLVVLSPDRLELLGPILFTAKGDLRKVSFNVLGQVAAMLRQHDMIARLRITVHVQPTKNPDRDMELSEKRGNAVRDWLIAKGVDKKRLEVRGFGGNKPLAPAKQKGSALLNDRIELIILERK